MKENNGHLLASLGKYEQQIVKITQGNTETFGILSHIVPKKDAEGYYVGVQAIVVGHGRVANHRINNSSTSVNVVNLEEGSVQIEIYDRSESFEVEEA